MIVVVVKCVYIIQCRNLSGVWVLDIVYHAEVCI